METRQGNIMLHFKDDELFEKAERRVGNFYEISQLTKDLLDTYPRNFNADISLLQNKKEVRAEFKRIYGSDKKYIAFYSVREDMIFVSVKNLNKRVMAHELGHVILTKFFGIMKNHRPVMPGTMQEVVCINMINKFL